MSTAGPARACERSEDIPCARSYAAHARSTCSGGHVCLVLSPNQEIKLFAAGAQAFAFAHGRWRIFDPASKYAVWRAAVAHDPVARVLYQTALDLAENRQGGLFVVVDDPPSAVGRLIASHDLLADEPADGPPAELTPGDPLAKRALHYLARGRDVTTLAPAVLEALSGIDGALVTDRSGRVLAFGAILRHDASMLPGQITAEGARTTGRPCRQSLRPRFEGQRRRHRLPPSSEERGSGTFEAREGGGKRKEERGRRKEEGGTRAERRIIRSSVIGLLHPSRPPQSAPRRLAQ